MHFSNFGSFVAFVSLRLSSHWSFGVCLLRVVVVVGLVSGECFSEFTSQWSCSWGFQQILSAGRSVSQVFEASHPGPTPLTTEGVSSVPGPLNQDPRPGALSPSTPTASQVLVPPVDQAPHPHVGVPGSLSTLPPRPGRFCFPALPRSSSRRLSGSPTPRRRRSRSPVNAHACDAPPLDQSSGPATPRLFLPGPVVLGPRTPLSWVGVFPHHAATH